MEEIEKSMKHLRDGQGNVVLDQSFAEVDFFDYIQGDVTKRCRKSGTYEFFPK